MICINTDIETDRAQCQMISGEMGVIRRLQPEREPRHMMKLPIKTICHLGFNVFAAFSWLQRKPRKCGLYS